MTARERLQAVIDGKQPDQNPQIGWPNSDLGDKLTFAEVDNPFGKALRKGTSLTGLLKRDVNEGEKELAGAAQEVRNDLLNAVIKGVDVIVYKLYGADTIHNTPMEYGGHFLEVDRSILTINDAPIIMVFVVGGADAFIDFVSDLPAQIFAWDVAGTGVGVSEVRQMRQGTLAAASADADIQLVYPGDISPVIQINNFANV